MATSIRTTVLAVALSAVAATAAASNVPGPSLWELNNRTSTAASSGIQLLAEENIIVTFCGLDLVGGDLWNAPAPNPDTCLSNCRTGCDAATWTNYNGGTCWYKRFEGSWASAVPSVGAASFIRTTRNTPGYMGPPGLPAMNVDMPGNDIDSVPGKDSSACIRPCATNSFCFAYTWSNYNGGTCWLKKKASAFVPSSGVTADFTGRVTNPDTCLA